MNKSGVVMAAGGVVIMFAATLAYAGDMGCGDKAGMQQKASAAAVQPASPDVKAVNVENTICPVMGGKVAPEHKVTVEYKGKSYNLCCTMCIEEFNKNPEKYVAKVEAELKAAEGAAVTK